jgi:predicted PurR-regulated permease PerM
VIPYAIQLIALALLLAWCFLIIQPFITLFVWGTVIAIALYPFHKILTKKLRGRNSWSAVIITILMLLIIIGPAVWFLLSSFGELKDLGTAYKAGELVIPPPPDKVKSWPLIGGQANELWTEASNNLTALIKEHTEEIKPLLLGLLNLITSTSKGILLFTLAIIVSGVLLAYATSAGSVIKSLFIKLAGKHGESMSEVAEVTVRNVAKGVLGVAVIQSMLAGIGFVVAGIPLAGLWILICLILAIVQIGILPVSIGAIIYIWGAADTLTATLFTIWMLLVGISDNILKPILLGKGAPVPMLVVFLGAIGGFILSGFIGLFTGAIVLSFGYNLMKEWLNPSDTISASKDSGGD